jgi:hypothetical protein
MTPLQQYQLWIGLGFAVLLVLFFIVAFFTKDQLSPGQLQILRFLASLCAGFSGALITGQALVQGDVPLGAAGKLVISGSAGFALFFLVWLTFDRTVTLPDSYNISIPEGLAFKSAVNVIASQDGAVAELVGFSAEETSSALNGQMLNCRSPDEALRLLRNLAKIDIPPYDVSRNGALITLRVR